MIVTVTANPSLDITMRLLTPLARGGVNRVAATTAEPGGKGVNVARVIASAGHSAVAVLPGSANDPMVAALHGQSLTFRNIATTAPVRHNIALTEPDGTTTKINQPGATLTQATVRELTATIGVELTGAQWLVLSGSLPGFELVEHAQHWYNELIDLAHAAGCRVALDTSDEPLQQCARWWPHHAPDLLKPNVEELAQVSGCEATELEMAAAHGDLAPLAAACQLVIDRGVNEVLATCGAAGALLATRDGIWHARTPEVAVASTVGAGDSTLAGYLLSSLAGAGPAERLDTAVRYGTAAVRLPGTALPTPRDASDLTATIRQLPTERRPGIVIPDATASAITSNDRNPS